MEPAELFKQICVKLGLFSQCLVLIRTRLMSYLHRLSHLLLNSIGAADSKQTKHCQESWVIELPLNECPELSVMFLATKKPNQNKTIFRIHRTEVIPQKHRGGLHQQEVSRKSCLPSAPSPLWWRSLLTSTVGKLFQARRVDKQGGGGRKFFEGQQPPWVPSARFLKCSQFQRKIAQEQEGAVLLGSWQAASPRPIINYLSQKIRLLLGKMLFVI